MTEHDLSLPIAPLAAHGRTGWPQRRLRAWLIVAAALSMASAAGASPAGGDAELLRQGNDVYLSGHEIAIRSPVAGDAMAAGGRVAVNAPVSGDAAVAGGHVSIDSSIGQDLYAAGGEVRVAGSVGRSARLAGGRVTLAPGADVAGSVNLAGGRVTLDGHVAGHALVHAGRTEVNGRVDGDLRVFGGELVLGPQAVVKGRVDYLGGEPLRKAPGAQVQGPIAQAQPERPGASHGVWFAVVWAIGWMLAGAALLALAPGASRRVTRALRARPAFSPVAGLAVLVGLPIVAVLLFVTVVGIPLGVLAIAALLALLPLGWIGAAAALGDAVVERRGPAKTWQRVLATAAALLALTLLGWVPYVGWAIGLLALLYGIGAVALAAMGSRKPQPAPQA